MYSPEPARAAMPRAAVRAAIGGRADAWVPAARWIRPAAAAFVIALHAALLAGLWSAVPPPLSAPSSGIPLEVFAVARPPSIRLAELGADLPQPEPPPPIIAARLPSLAIPAAATEIAITISQSTAVTISEANPMEVANVVLRCGTARRAASASGGRGPGMTLLVRVEQDGRVTDSRVEVGSGNERLDESARSCLREHGVLTPQQIRGVSVASWQRVHWSAS